MRRGSPSAWRRVVGAVLALAVLASPALGAGGGAAPAAPPAAPETHRVGLITGDVVTVQVRPGDRRGIEVALADREGYETGYEVREVRGETYVLPTDAQGLIGDTLDRELFNVTKLVEYGYDVERGLPVIVKHDHDARRAPLRSAPGIRDVAPLASIDGEAGTVDGGDDRFWRAVTEPRGTRAAMSARVDRVWLDEPVRATLDVSAPIVGAPQAWAQGYDGAGMKVAVLDTGIDTTHPDLAGRVAAERNFTFSDTTADQYGHGTHVAGIVAGGGARYRGVAPGATLMNGKVLGDGGTGLASWTIDGMEWAVAAGADVVNLSLGSSFASNGQDPVSLAVDRLTAEADVAFVISAGNSGPGAGTIGSPGAASSGITVGAVEKSGSLPRWSSRGPRAGDSAIKPDLTAPGAGIVAARNAGGLLGTPVDGSYTRLSGTSMAAPHVAGAAAILRQRRPDMSAREVKSALVTTAVPNAGLHVYQQGGGRLDIPAALAVPVRVAPAPLDFGFFAHPQEDAAPVQREVTYTNDLDRPIELDLSFEVTNHRTGAAPSKAMLGLDRERLALGAGASAAVTVTLDPAAGDFGLYGGRLVAREEGTAVSRLPVGFRLQAPRYTLTIEARDRTGAPAGGLSSVDVLDVHDLNEFSAWRGLSGTPVTLQVPHGTYAIVGRISNDHPVHGRERSIVALPELSVTRDTTVVLDARAARRIEVAAPGRGTAPLPHVPVTAGIRRETAAGQSWAVAEAAPPDQPLYATPSAPVSIGGLEMFNRWLLGPAGRGADPVLYDLVRLESGRIPADLRYRPRHWELAKVVNRYHSDRPNQVIAGTRFVELPGWDDVDELGVTEEFNVPVERAEYSTGGIPFHRRLRWPGVFTEPSIVTGTENYAAGERLIRSWFERPAAPGVREAHRLGNALRLSTSPWIDAAGNTSEGDAAYAFDRNGERVAEGTDPTALPLSSDPAEYRLELRSAFRRDWWRTSTAASTAWTFRSAPSEENVPLLHVEYDLDLDLRNTASRHGRPEVDIAVRHQTGAAVAGARLWTSDDDGATWRARHGRQLGSGRYRFSLDSGARDYVSLRVEAWDAAGNRVEQEITRAYATRGRPEPVPPGGTERVSLTTSGAQANRLSSAPPAISADGRYVAFTSLATNLVPGAPGVAGGVYVRDRRTGRTERASVASDGTAATGNAPAISADGRFVAFSGFDPTLVREDRNGQPDVFVHDRVSRTTERVSVASDGTEGNNGASSAPPAISAGGRYVAFSSYASNLVPGDTNGSEDMFVHDRATGETERVSIATDGSETERFTSSSMPSISADGRFVAFASGGSNLVAGDANNTTDIFVRDRAVGTTERVSVAGDGSEANSFSSDTAISADGRFVAFGSFASNLVPGDANNSADVFVHDRATGATERASVASDGREGNGFTSGPAISADGRYVGFASGSTNLVAADTNEWWDIFLHDRATGATERVSIADNGGEANEGSLTATTISRDGRHVAFASSASNLVPGDTNGQGDAFVRDRTGGRR
jgi:subtilisin family serine protease/Tol biopolymer transport system component